jgi:DNA-binding CsgD family transcriptional regulator
MAEGSIWPRVAEKADAIGVVEAAYELEATEQTWMRLVVERALALVPGACRGTAYSIDISNVSAPSFGMPVNVGFGPRFDSRLLDAMNTDGPTLVKLARRKVGTLTETLGSRLDGTPMGDFVLQEGSPDAIGWVALDAEGRGIVVATDLPSVTRLPRALRSRWELIGAHLAAAHRLRRKATSAPADECVVTPEGRVLHAEGKAVPRAVRERLRELVVARDRARTRASRTDADAALECWPGLVAGRWSLVDRFERDGRRYIVARCNEPRPPRPLCLTLRERQVLGHMLQGDSMKVTAYSLGLDGSTVSSLAASLRLKLGARSIAGLLTRFGQAPQ